MSGGGEGREAAKLGVGRCAEVEAGHPVSNAYSR